MGIVKRGGKGFKERLPHPVGVFIERDRYFIQAKKWVLPLMCEETNLPMELADLHWLKYSTDSKTLIDTLKGLMGENES